MTWNFSLTQLIIEPKALDIAETALPKIEPNDENIPETAPAPEDSPDKATLRPASATTRSPP